MIQEIRAIKIKVAVKHSKNAQNKCQRRLSSTPCLNNRVFSRKRSALPRSLALFLSILSNRSVRLAASITARWIEFSASRNSLCVALSWFSSSSSSSWISVVLAVVFSRSSLLSIFLCVFFLSFSNTVCFLHRGYRASLLYLHHFIRRQVLRPFRALCPFRRYLFWWDERKMVRCFENLRFAK